MALFIGYLKLSLYKENQVFGMVICDRSVIMLISAELPVSMELLQTIKADEMHQVL